MSDLEGESVELRIGTENKSLPPHFPSLVPAASHAPEELCRHSALRPYGLQLDEGELEPEYKILVPFLYPSFPAPKPWIIQKSARLYNGHLYI